MIKKTFQKLTILLPVRNEGINITIMLKILEAVLQIPHEILVIYDDKNDNTIPIIRKLQRNYPSLKSVFNIYGKGVVNAIKAGVNAASGKYILILK